MEILGLQSLSSQSPGNPPYKNVNILRNGDLLNLYPSRDENQQRRA